MTVSDGFRAPSVPELFFGQSDSYPELQDPCDVNSPNFTGSGNQQTNAQCQSHGVPDGFTQPNSQIRITVGGNPELQPEESENFSFGMVYQPGWLDGFQVELDWFDIEIANTISAIGDQNILEQCYSDTPQYCEHVDRGAGGFVTDLRDLATNVGALAVSGIDMAVSLSGVDTDWGIFDLAWDMTQYDNWESTDALGTRFLEVGYVFGSSRNNNVDLRSTAHVGWTRGPWSARWSWQYIAEGKGVANTPPSYDADGTYDAGDEVRTLDARLYNDIVASYLWERNAYSVTFAAGVDNLAGPGSAVLPRVVRQRLRSGLPVVVQPLLVRPGQALLQLGSRAELKLQRHVARGGRCNGVREPEARTKVTPNAPSSGNDASIGIQVPGKRP